VAVTGGHFALASTLVLHRREVLNSEEYRSSTRDATRTFCFERASLITSICFDYNFGTARSPEISSVSCFTALMDLSIKCVNRDTPKNASPRRCVSAVNQIKRKSSRVAPEARASRPSRLRGEQLSSPHRIVFPQYLDRCLDRQRLHRHAG